MLDPHHPTVSKISLITYFYCLSLGVFTGNILLAVPKSLQKGKKKRELQIAEGKIAPECGDVISWWKCLHLEHLPMA